MPANRTIRSGLVRDRFGALVALSAVGAVGVASALAGVGLTASVPQFRQVTAWLVNAAQGSVTRANGLSGRADARISLSDAAGHRLRVLQDGSVVLVEDETTHQVSRIDPAQLQVTQTTSFGAAGLDLVADAHVAYAVDPVRHLVQRVDPVTLSLIGGALDVGAAPGAGVLDSHDVLWLPLPDRGQLLPVTASGPAGAPAAGTPVAVGGDHDAMTVALAGDTPVVVDSTAGTLTVAGASGARLTVTLPGGFSGAGPGAVLVPDETDGALVPVLAAGSGRLVVVNTASGTSSVVSLAVPPAERLGTPQQVGSRVYVPDQSTGMLLVYDAASGQLLPQIKVSGTSGPLDVFVKDGMLWADAENTADAVSVDGGGAVHRIGKYQSDVAGGPTSPSTSATSTSAQDSGPGTPSRPASTTDTAGSRPQPSEPSGPPTAPILPTGAGTRSSSADVVVSSTSHTSALAPSPSSSPSSASSSAPTSSSPSSSAPPPAPPQAPTAPNATPGPGVITVRFTPSAGGTPTGYVLTGAPANATVTPATIPADGSKPYAFQVTGLSCGQTYPFAVAALYAGGQVPSVSTAPVRPCVPPSAPQLTGASFQTVEHAIALTWTAPSSDGGGSVQYTVGWSGGATGSSPLLTGLSYTISSLTNQQTYTVSLTAANPAGSSTPPATASGLLDGPHVSANVYNNSSLTVNMRSGPHLSDQVRHTFPATPAGGRGAAVTVICQTAGDSFTDPVDPAVTGDIWDQVLYNGQRGYISDLYVSTPNSVAGRYQSYSDPPLWRCS